jgi:hypothetical protein
MNDRDFVERAWHDARGDALTAVKLVRDRRPELGLREAAYLVSAFKPVVLTEVHDEESFKAVERACRPDHETDDRRSRAQGLGYQPKEEGRQALQVRLMMYKAGKGGEVTVRNEAKDAVTRELRDRGIDYAIEHGRKHTRVVFVLNGRRRMIITPNYNGNWRSKKYARADVRRMLRQAAI